MDPLAEPQVFQAKSSPDPCPLWVRDGLLNRELEMEVLPTPLRRGGVRSLHTMALFRMLQINVVFKALLHGWSTGRVIPPGLPTVAVWCDPTGEATGDWWNDMERSPRHLPPALPQEIARLPVVTGMEGNFIWGLDTALTPHSIA